MNLTRYRYSGPPSAVTLHVGHTRELLDVLLRPGGPVEMPADHDYTLVLLALNHLQPLPIAHTKPTGKPPVTQHTTKE